MSDLLTKNLNSLFKRYPNLKKAIEERRNLGSYKNYSFKDGKLMEGVELVDSNAADFVSCDQYKKEHTKILILEGLGLGNLLKKATQYFEGRFKDLIIVEPAIDALLSAFSEVDFEAYISDNRFHWLVGRNRDGLFADFLDLLRVPERAFQMDACQFIKHPIISKKYSGYFADAQDEWLAACKQTRRSFGGIEDSLIGFGNVLRNLKFIENNPGVLATRDLFQKVPAIIVSAGPSLDKSIPELKKLQDKAVIIAVDASLNILLENGITPHAVVALERDDGPRTFFEAVRKKNPKIPTHLFSFPVVQKEALEIYPGPSWVVYRDYGYFQYFEQQLQRGMISSSSSVAHLALRLAFCFGCSPVLLVGQDLAYEPGTLRSHATGLAYEGWDKGKTLEEVKKTILDDNLGDFFEVEGNKVPKVPTNSTYFVFMKEFSFEASRLPFKIFNCTEGGAKIPGIEWAELSKVTAGWKSHPDLLKKLDDKRAQFKTQRFDWKEIRNFLQSIASKIEEMVQLISLPDLPEDQKMQIATVIRQAQVELMKDPRYICFLIQNAGREYLDFENEWATKVENPSFTAAQRLEFLGSGLKIVQSVAQRLNDQYAKYC